MSTAGAPTVPIVPPASEEHGFTFISKKTNIGQARQLGYLASSGKYVVSNFDTDDVAVDVKGAKRLYHEVVEHDPIRRTTARSGVVDSSLSRDTSWTMWAAIPP